MMKKRLEIEILSNRQINFVRWDKAISESVNSMVYAQTWFLDIVCPDWKAIVDKDYTYLFPFCPGKKFFTSYAYQPFFTQQLGLFSPTIPYKQLVEAFIDILPVKYIDIQLNYMNKFEKKGYQIEERINYELELIAPYEYLYHNYHSNTKRNINKANKNKVQVLQAFSIHAFLAFYRQEMSSITKDLSSKSFLLLNQIIVEAIKSGKGKIYCAYSERNELISAAFFLKSTQRYILLANATNEEGKAKGANFKLIDQFIQDHQQQVLTLDFEGSMVPGVARFYAGFGAKKIPYLHIKKNKLNKLLKIFKQ